MLPPANTVATTVTFQFLRAKDAAELLRCGKSTFYAHVASGVLPPATRIAGLRLWRRSDIEAIAEGRA